MKNLLTIFMFILSFQLFGQTVLIMNDTSQWRLISVKRGNNIMIPTWDGNGRLIQGVEVLSDPVYADYACLVDSLTTPGPYISPNVFKFTSNVDKEIFLEFAEQNGCLNILNNIGDVCLNPCVDVLFNIYSGMWEQYFMNKGEEYNRMAELYQAGFIFEIYYPTQDTPPYHGCDN